MPMVIFRKARHQRASYDSLSLIYLFFIAVDLPELFGCLETLKRIIQYFSPPG